MDLATVAKHTVKFLSVCQNPITFHQVLRTAPDSLVKIICNAALNALKGDVALSADTRQRLHKYRKPIILLISKTVPLARKRALLQSKQRTGGFYFVPALLTAVFSSLGDSLFAD